jgi:predicted DNA-binding ribbon-helix-helix protein
MASMVSGFTTTPIGSEASDKNDANVIRSVNVHGRRTSIRLEGKIWDSLAEICRRESCTPHDVCSYVAERKPVRGLLTSWLQIFIVDYFRRSATEDGHRSAGHGQGMFQAQQLERRHIRAKKKASVKDSKIRNGSSRSMQRARGLSVRV